LERHPFSSRTFAHDPVVIPQDYDQQPPSIQELEHLRAISRDNPLDSCEVTSLYPEFTFVLVNRVLQELTERLWPDNYNVIVRTAGACSKRIHVLYVLSHEGEIDG